MEETETAVRNMGETDRNVEETATTVEFPTGGEFRGKTIHGRMEGSGEYIFPSGTKYIGEFKDGMFHGSGTLFFPNGGRLEATWSRGQATGPGVGGNYIFKDQLEYGEDSWEYCTLKDRRFYSEICNGIKPAGRTQLTDSDEPPEIPLGWYDCGDGLYNPSNRVVYDYNKEFLRNADTDEHDWILKTCRKGVTEEEQFPIGKD